MDCGEHETSLSQALNERLLEALAEDLPKETGPQEFGASYLKSVTKLSEMYASMQSPAPVKPFPEQGDNDLLSD